MGRASGASLTAPPRGSANSCYPDRFKRVSTAFDELCRSVGRNPSEIVKATSLPVPANDQMMKDFRKTLSSIIAAGIRYFILLPPPDNNLDLLKRFAREVVPEFRH